MTVRTNLYGTYDDLTELHDSASAITGDHAGTVGGSAATIDIGSGYIDGTMIVYVSACDVTSGNELYEVKLQGSNVTGGTFTSGDIVDLAVLRIGDAAVLPGTGDKTTGLYKFPIHNQLGTKTWRYLRCYLDVAGTTPSLTYNAWLSK